MARTGSPTASAAVRARVSGPVRSRRTRRVVAPVANSRTGPAENSMRPSPRPSNAPRPSGCRAASRSAGCRSWRAASAEADSGSVTSAYTAVSSRQAASRPGRRARSRVRPRAGGRRGRGGEFLRTRRRPGREVVGRVRSGLGGEDAGGVPGPLGAGVGRGAGVHGEGTVAAGVGCLDAQLQGDSVVLGQGQRAFQDELADLGAGGVGAGGQGEFEEGGARDDGRAAEAVRGEPARGAGGEAAGEQQGVVDGGRDDRAEQRMAGGDESGGGRIARGGGGLDPVALVLEGVGGQVHRAGAGGGGRARRASRRVRRGRAGRRRRPAASPPRRGRRAGRARRAGRCRCQPPWARAVRVASGPSSRRW